LRIKNVIWGISKCWWGPYIFYGMPEWEIPRSITYKINFSPLYLVLEKDCSCIKLVQCCDSIYTDKNHDNNYSPILTKIFPFWQNYILILRNLGKIRIFFQIFLWFLSVYGKQYHVYYNRMLHTLTKKWVRYVTTWLMGVVFFSNLI